jgi:hypothetical protein
LDAELAQADGSVVGWLVVIDHTWLEVVELIDHQRRVELHDQPPWLVVGSGGNVAVGWVLVGGGVVVLVGVGPPTMLVGVGELGRVLVGRQSTWPGARVVGVVVVGMRVAPPAPANRAAGIVEMADDLLEGDGTHDGSSARVVRVGGGG